MPAAVAIPVRPRLLLFGLDESLVSEIQTALPCCDAWVETEPFHNSLNADIVFCSDNCEDLPGVLAAAKARKLPVVIVTRHPNVNDWLNAMDAGASDYAAPPFEPKQLRWILDANLLQK